LGCGLAFAFGAATLAFAFAFAAEAFMVGANGLEGPIRLAGALFGLGAGFALAGFALAGAFARARQALAHQHQDLLLPCGELGLLGRHGSLRPLGIGLYGPL
jgi:hypothetical protein